jgi:hypothetical protein
MVTVSNLLTGVLGATLVGVSLLGMAPVDVQQTQESSYSRLNALAKTSSGSLEPDPAREIALELADGNFSEEFFADVDDSDAKNQLADLLSSKQMAWQTQKARGVTGHGFLRAMNEELELDKAPNHLRLRSHDLTRVRTQLWLRVPALVSGKSRKDAHAGVQIFSPTMSPFEAFLAADVLLHKKAYDDDYTRTLPEERARGWVISQQRRGLYVLPDNPRRDEFLAHMKTVASRKWSSVPDALEALGRALEGR